VALSGGIRGMAVMLILFGCPHSWSISC